jgi:uncharacterized protein (TIGR00255 family)
MIQSMTGFGEATGSLDGVYYSLEVRSLNNKYFKATLRMPDELNALEPVLESALRSKINRGSLVVAVNVATQTEKAALEVNHHALSKYIAQLRESPEFGSGQLQIQLAPLMTLPGVLQRPAETERKLDEVRTLLLGLLDDACAHLLSMRRREGLVLVDDLMSHHTLIAERLAVIRDRAPQVVADYQSRLHERVNALLEELGRTIDPADLIKEVAIFAERSDIAEEVSRLSAHLDQFAELLSREDGKPVGRTLDFLTQEMLREANTIASKSGDAEISRSIVEVKGAIDRIKEQVQNLE